jgi:hypothetical protein
MGKKDHDQIDLRVHPEVAARNAGPEDFAQPAWDAFMFSHSYSHAEAKA